jgi:hypothetical protein
MTNGGTVGAFDAMPHTAVMGPGTFDPSHEGCTIELGMQRGLCRQDFHHGGLGKSYPLLEAGQLRELGGSQCRCSGISLEIFIAHRPIIWVLAPQRPGVLSQSYHCSPFEVV